MQASMISGNPKMDMLLTKHIKMSFIGTCIASQACLKTEVGLTKVRYNIRYLTMAVDWYNPIRHGQTSLLYQKPCTLFGATACKTFTLYDKQQIRGEATLTNLGVE